jgi:hypothetical protein
MNSVTARRDRVVSASLSNGQVVAMGATNPRCVTMRCACHTHGQTTFYRLVRDALAVSTACAPLLRRAALETASEWTNRGARDLLLEAAQECS